MVLKHENEFVIFYFTKDNIGGENIYRLLVNVKTKKPQSEDIWKNTVNLMKSYYESAQKGNFRFSILFDLRKLGILPQRYYQEWANLFIESKKLTEKHILATCIITNNKILKASLNTFFMIYKTVRPFKFVSNLEDANQFLEKQSNLEKQSHIIKLPA